MVDQLVQLREEQKLPSPIRKIEGLLPAALEVELFVKLENEIHPFFNGNKYRKLIGNLQKFYEGGFDCLVTFGGAFSNHIYTTAAVCHHLKIPAHFIIRGEEDLNNPTLQFVRKHGGKVHFVSRTTYRDKHHALGIQKILQTFGDYFLVPEGGTNDHCLKGTKVTMDEANQQGDFDQIVVAVGTGGTAAGLSQGLLPNQQLLAFSSLKIERLSGSIFQSAVDRLGEQLQFFNKYHFGGYGKVTDELIDFIEEVFEKTSLAIDPIYNAKCLYGLLDLAKKENFPKGTRLLWVNTGGIQGLHAYNYMASKKGRRQILPARI